MKNNFIVLFRLKSNHIVKVKNKVINVKIKYHHHAKLFFKMSTFISNKLC